MATIFDPSSGFSVNPTAQPVSPFIGQNAIANAAPLPPPVTPGGVGVAAGVAGGGGTMNPVAMPPVAPGGGAAGIAGGVAAGVGGGGVLINPVAMPPANPMQPQPSVGHQALRDQNPRNVQSYMTALNNVGAGRNGFQNASADPTQAPVQNLYPTATSPTVSPGSPPPPPTQYGPGGAYSPTPAQGVVQPTQYTPPGGIMNPGAPLTPPQGIVPPISSPALPASGGIMNPGAAPGGVVGNVVSDIRAKTDIHSGERNMDDFLGKLGVHSYKYKDPSDGAGTYVSPMAQELEKTKLGKSMVITRPDGKKMVDYGRGFGVMLSGQAYINQRLNDIEKKFKLTTKKGK